MKTRSRKVVGLLTFFLVVILIVAATLGIPLYLKNQDFPIHPRTSQVEADPSFTFHTAYGNFNQTADYLLQIALNSDSFLDPEEYAWGESYIH